MRGSQDEHSLPKFGRPYHHTTRRFELININSGKRTCARWPVWYLCCCALFICMPGMWYSVQYRPANKKLVFGVSRGFLFVAQGQVTSLYHVFLSTEGVENVFSYLGFSCSCRIFGKGDPCLEFSMAVSAGSGTRRSQPATTSNKLPGK